jgi:hypothetical protein
VKKKIESYNASYPAAFYEIGTLYAFYGNKNSKGTPATDECVRHFSAALKALEIQKKSNAIQPVKNGTSNTPASNGELERFYAVVVSKSAKNIEVMFLNNDNGVESYLTRKYVVSSSCTTDGKDLIPPSTRTNVTGLKGTAQKVGGITRVQNNTIGGKVGGITKVAQTSITSTNIGGITRMKRSNTSSVSESATASYSKPAPKVGGITRMKK